MNVKEILPDSSWDGGPLVMHLKDHIRKVDVKGKAICQLCLNKVLTYGERGVTSLVDHVKRKTHVEKVVNLRVESSPPLLLHLGFELAHLLKPYLAWS